MPVPTKRAKDSKSIQTVGPRNIEPVVFGICCDIVHVSNILSNFGDRDETLTNRDSVLLIIESLNYLTRRAITFINRHQSLYTVPVPSQ
jgi:hypothetical protein